MYSCSNWGLCFSGFLHWLHDSQKSVLAYDKQGKLAAGIRVQPRKLDLFPCKFSCAMNGKFRGFLAEVGVSSSRVLLRCLFNLPFRHRWSWKLCPLLKAVLVVITPGRAKVFLGRFCSGITRLRSATRARALSPSLRARASPVTDVGSQHVLTHLQRKTRGEHDHIEVAEDVSRDSTQ